MSISDNEDVLLQAMRIMGQRGGLKGGKYRGPNGFSRMDPKRARELSAKGGATGSSSSRPNGLPPVNGVLDL